jgi:protein-tyrosine kinase
VDYLYRALTRETGLADRETAEESPAANFLGGELKPTPAEAWRPTASSANSEAAPPAIAAPALKAEEAQFYPDVVTNSAAVRQNPERFYAFSSERMTKDRILGLEQIRVLRSRILELMRVRGMRTLMVTSSLAGEGKTVTATNLALALSQVQGLRLLLVDTDLRKPSVARTLGLNADASLVGYLRSELTLQQVTMHLNERLSVIPAEKTNSSVELLHSEQMKAFIRGARENYDLVIFDAPPLYSIADAQILANYVDAVMLCIRAGHTSTGVAAECAGMVAAKLIGAVLVGGERQPHGYYSYSYSDRKAEDSK